MDLKLQPTTRQPAHRRLVGSVAAAHRRLLRGAAADAQPVWNARLGVWLAAALAAVVLVGFFDGTIVLAMRGADDPMFRLMAWITNIGKSQWYLVPAALIFLGVGLYDWSLGGRRARVRLSLLFGQAAYVFAAVALSGIFVNVVKVFFGRARPWQIDQFGAWHFAPWSFGYDFASFPSGHSATVGAVVGVLAIWFPRWAIVIVELGLFFAATRTAALAHYPSDVLAGFTVGWFFSIVLARWLAARGVVFGFVPGKILPRPAPVLPRKTVG